MVFFFNKNDKGLIDLKYENVKMIYQPKNPTKNINFIGQKDSSLFINVYAPSSIEGSNRMMKELPKLLQENSVKYIRRFADKINEQWNHTHEHSCFEIKVTNKSYDNIYDFIIKLCNQQYIDKRTSIKVFSAMNDALEANTNEDTKELGSETPKIN